MNNHEQVIMAMTAEMLSPPALKQNDSIGLGISDNPDNIFELEIEHAHDHHGVHHQPWDHAHNHSHELTTASEDLNIFQKIGRSVTSKVYNSKLINSPSTEQVLAGTCCGNICSRADVFAVFTGGALLTAAWAKDKWPSRKSKNQTSEFEKQEYINE